MMKKANWVLGVAMLACAGLVSSQRASHAQADEELRPEEYGAFAAVCDRELTAVGEKATRPLCVRVPPRKSPPERLLRYLRMARVPVSAQRACYPRHQLPRGMEISLEKIRRLPGPILELKVDTASNQPQPAEHVVVPLRLGTYRLKRDAAGTWVVVDYANDLSGD